MTQDYLHRLLDASSTRSQIKPRSYANPQPPPTPASLPPPQKPLPAPPRGREGATKLPPKSGQPHSSHCPATSRSPGQRSQNLPEDPPLPTRPLRGLQGLSGRRRRLQQPHARLQPRRLPRHRVPLAPAPLGPSRPSAPGELAALPSAQR